MKRSFGIGLALAAVSSANAQVGSGTGTVVATGSVPFAFTDWSDLLSVARFNNPLVHLDSVEVKFHGTNKGTLQLENKSPTDRAWTADLAYSLLLQGPSGAPLVSIRPTAVSKSGTLPAFDGTTDYGGASGVSFLDLASEDTGSVTLTDPSEVAQFVGAGNLSLPVAGFAQSTINATGNFSKVVTNQSAADVTLTYRYSYKPAKLGDRAFLDANGNGVQDPGEPGLSGVAVSLLDGSGKVVGTTTTNDQGFYTFEGLVPGTYAVQFDALGGYERSPRAQGADRTKDSDADADGRTSPVTLASGESRLDLDAGYKASLMLGDRVFFDANGNGIQDDGERGLEGVKVLLLDKNGNPVLDASGAPISDVSDSQGSYLFTDLPAGDYKVKFVAPVGYQFTARGVGNDPAVDSDVDSNGLTQVVGLTADNLNVDAGLYGSLCLGDRVWRDYDKDGLQDACESGVPGVKVTLLDAKGNVIDTRTTDKYGYYKFANVAPGEYSVDFDAPDGYGFTKPFADSRYKAYDSNVDPATGRASVVLGSTDLTIDAGLIGALKIGDTVWLDGDGDGKFDADQGEKGIANVRVYLLGDTTGDGRADVSAWTTTDKNGHYQFLGLTPGLYQVTLNGYDLPRNLVQTTRYGSNFANVGLARLGDKDNLDFDFGYKPVSAPVGCGHGYWICNVPKWAWDCLWIGNKCQTKATVCAWMKRNDCGDKSIALYQRLCAAKLNVGNGCNGGKVYTSGKTTCSLKEAIRRADEWIASNPAGCKVWSNSAKWASICDAFAILDAHCNGK